MGHQPSVERTDDRSKYGNLRRNYTGICSCGWRADWATVSKAAAQERADKHAATAGDE